MLEISVLKLNKSLQTFPGESEAYIDCNNNRVFDLVYVHVVS